MVAGQPYQWEINKLWNLFIKVHGLLISTYSASLANVFNFCDVFLQICSIWCVNFSLKPKYIPNKFSHE